MHRRGYRSMSSESVEFFSYSRLHRALDFGLCIFPFISISIFIFIWGVFHFLYFYIFYHVVVNLFFVLLCCNKRSNTSPYFCVWAWRAKIRAKSKNENWFSLFIANSPNIAHNIISLAILFQIQFKSVVNIQ